ncbi:MAG TPA: DNA repair protein RadC [Chloroflexota bacterium]|nr:DNA repair protein RadC [Chloroflexota bacterium]
MRPVARPGGAERCQITRPGGGRISGDGLEYHPSIKALPAHERPRERLYHQGPAALKEEELVAIILRTGVRGMPVLDLARSLLAHYGGLGGLARVGASELRRFNGLGMAKAVELQAALELGRRLAGLHPEARPQVRSPADLANLLMPEMAFLEQEHLRVVLLNTKNQVLAAPEVYVGSLNTSVVRVAELFREAIRQNAAAIIVVHNHPSGDPTPSAEDVEVTRQLIDAGALLDIEVLDHLVIGHQRYVSLRERGLAFRAS